MQHSFQHQHFSPEDGFSASACEVEGSKDLLFKQDLLKALRRSVVEVAELAV